MHRLGGRYVNPRELVTHVPRDLYEDHCNSPSTAYAACPMRNPVTPTQSDGLIVDAARGTGPSASLDFGWTWLCIFSDPTWIRTLK